MSLLHRLKNDMKLLARSLDVYIVERLEIRWNVRGRGEREENDYECFINPRRACAASVTVLGLCVCVCVCVSVCPLHFGHYE